MGVLVASTVAGLGTPTVDGANGLIRLANGHEQALTWNLAQQVWVGRPAVSMRQVDDMGMGSSGVTAGWKYPVIQETPGLVVNPTAFGFRIHKLLHAGDLWDAGLRLQEHLTGELRVTGDAGGGDSKIALSWYPLAEGDPFLSPVSFNHGVPLTLPNSSENTVYKWCSTGWQNNTTVESDTPPLPGDHFYPEIYTYGPPVNFREFTALHRWVGGPGIGSSGSFEDASQYPPIDTVVQWNVAEHIPVADNAAVAEWADFSGRGQAFRQPTGANQPLLKRDAPGSFRYVKFDGSNDFLSTVATPVPVLQQEPNNAAMPVNVSQPVTVFLVMRQRAAGATQQVWLGNGGGSSALLYRGDATDQVNVWCAGTDVTYHRSSAWPSPWMIWSVVLSGGGDVNVWENLTQKVSGSGAGGNAFGGGFILGSGVGSLPAAIDVAELVVANRAANNTERTAVVNYLNAKYSIF